MTLQPLNFGKTTRLSFRTGLLAGVITLCCGVTASFVSHSNKVGGALVGSTAGVMVITTLKKRQEHEFRLEMFREVRHIFDSELESRLASINSNFEVLESRFNELQTKVNTPIKLQTLPVKPKPKIIPTSLHPINAQSPNFPDLIALLNSYGVKVEEDKQPLPLDDLFDDLAMSLGEEYGILEPLHYQIIKSLRIGKRFSFSLVNSSQKAVGICTKFCESLHGKSLLDSYYYDKKQKVIYAAPQIGNAEITQFLNGGWFERFVYKKVSNFLVSQAMKYQSLRNAQIILKNGDRFELDLLFLVNNELIWIECKSGQQSSSSLRSYCERRGTLRVPKERALLVGLKLSDDQTANWTNLWDMTVVNNDNLLNSVRSAVGLPDNS